MLVIVTIAGQSSNSCYSLLVGLRALAQTISYEVSLAFIRLYFVISVCRYNLVYFHFFQVYLWLICLSLPLSLIYFLFGWEYEYFFNLFIFTCEEINKTTPTLFRPGLKHVAACVL